MKEKNKESVIFYGALATLSNKFTKVKRKIQKIAIFYDNGCYLRKV